uniref:FLYWCH-type domain-containing protein n=1 Tax=Romanomermis culicivorax TaxID=13658 RepID=A0A915J5T5_ROMCU
MSCFLLTEKGRKKLIFDGYGYIQDYSTYEKIYWRCEFKNTCKGRAHTEFNAIDGAQVEIGCAHSHPPDATKEEVTNAINKIRSDAINTVESTHTVVSMAINQVSPACTPKLPKTANLKRTVLRKRQGNVPPQPQTLDDLKIVSKRAEFLLQVRQLTTTVLKNMEKLETVTEDLTAYVKDGQD